MWTNDEHFLQHTAAACFSVTYLETGRIPHSGKALALIQRFFADIETHQSPIDYQRSWHINPPRYRAVVQIPCLYAQRYLLMLTDKDNSLIWSLFRKHYRILSPPHYQLF